MNRPDRGPDRISEANTGNDLGPRIVIFQKIADKNHKTEKINLKTRIKSN